MPLASVVSAEQVVRLHLVTAADRRRMARQVADSIDALIPDHVNRATVGKWAAEHRILPQGLTPVPGPFRWEVTPYLREIADCFSETSDVQRVAVMKGAQLGFTVGVLENFIGYIIDAAPGPTMFVSGDKGMAEASIELRVDRMIESAGLEGKVFSQSEKKHNKKTGDTKAKKEFPGGFLLAIGPNVGAKLRQFSVRYLLFDEVDAYPQEIGSEDRTKGKVASEGDPISLAEKRTDAFEAIRKILYISTPLVEQSSKIKPLFLRGDQRYFYVPCKHCGAMQPLLWRDAEGKYRLKYELDKVGRLRPETVHYECEACGGHWSNEDKAWFLPRGKWRATAEASEPGFRSYHLSALYSPVEMHSWEGICREWIAVGNPPDQARLRTFVNTTLGECFQERGDAPRWELVALRREDYHIHTLPKTARPLILTVGADVQADHIAVETMAWGKDKESWSISYEPLPGDTSNSDGEAWKALAQILSTPHAGLRTAMALIDAGYNTPAVYQFCERYMAGVLPVKGSTINVDERALFAVRDVPGYQVKRVDLNTDKLKTELYSYLVKGKPEQEGQPFPPGYCHFPIDYDDRYYRMLTAEERMRERTRSGFYRMVWHLPHGRANHALDARVYALGALYVIYGLRRQEIEEQDTEAKRTPRDYSWAAFWEELEGLRKGG